MTSDAGHHAPTDPPGSRRRSTLLGLLGPRTRRAGVREVHLAEGCATCESEVRAFGAAVADIGRAVAPVAPGPSVRERLPARGCGQARGARDHRGPADDTGWGAGLAPVIMARLLIAIRQPGTSPRVSPHSAASQLAHAHAAPEELTLAGELRLGDIRLRAADYCAGDPGEPSRRVGYPEGCAFIVHASLDDRIGDEGLPPRRASSSSTRVTPRGSRDRRRRHCGCSSENAERRLADVAREDGPRLRLTRRAAAPARADLRPRGKDGAIAGEIPAPGTTAGARGGFPASTRSGCIAPRDRRRPRGPRFQLASQTLAPGENSLHAARLSFAPRSGPNGIRLAQSRRAAPPRAR